jgi:glucosamine 6-phosphate synthetase-like amidotransferase/phosphosugar isomerase protein
MCGIFGIVAKREQLLGEILVEAGRRLSYRGYDSVGCATFPPKLEQDTDRGLARVASRVCLLKPARCNKQQVFTQSWCCW